jgi:hypothetical protein
MATSQRDLFTNSTSSRIRTFTTKSRLRATVVLECHQYCIQHTRSHLFHALSAARTHSNAVRIIYDETDSSIMYELLS